MAGFGTSQHEVGSIVRQRPFWLPPTGHGNGLDDDAWVILLDVASATAGDELLDAMAAAGVPAHAAPMRAPLSGTVRIWVGASGYGRAEAVLMRVLPTLVRRYGESVIR